MLQDAVKIFFAWCYHLAPVFMEPASILQDLGFSSSKSSSKNKCAYIIPIKIPLSASFPLKMENILVNIPHIVIGSFKFILSQKGFRMKIIDYSVLFLELFLYFFLVLRSWIKYINGHCFLGY